MSASHVIGEYIFRQSITGGTFTVPTIAAQTGYSKTMVAKAVAELIGSGLVEELESGRTGSKGRRAITYTLCRDAFFFLGVDIKNYGLAIGLMDLKGNLVDRCFDPSYSFENTHTNLDAVCTAVETFVASHGEIGKGRIAGATFNLGGRVNSLLGTSASMFNLEETQDTPLADLLGDRLGFPVYIENDTKSMAFADYSASGEKWQNVLYVNIGWGLGMAIILDGKIYRGTNGYSGEMGHMRCYDNNILCRCGKKGCMETEVSGQAILRKLLERVRKGESSILSWRILHGEDIGLDDIIEATEKEDPLCMELVTRTAIELGKHLAGMINIFNPECIIIGGTISQAMPYNFRQQVVLSIRQYSLKLMSKNLVVKTSAYGDNAGLIGACMIARDKVLTDLV